jgi:hypothetical protein
MSVSGSMEIGVQSGVPKGVAGAAGATGSSNRHEAVSAVAHPQGVER